MIEELKQLHIVDQPKNRFLYRVLGMFNVYPNNVSFSTQNKGEEVVIIMRKHIIRNLPWAITTIFLFLLPLIVSAIFGFYDHNINDDALTQGSILQSVDQVFVWILLGFYMSFVITFAFFKFVHWYYDIFIITNERYISIDFDLLKGRTITDIPLTDIIDISEKVFGFFPTIFGYGIIEFKTTSEKLSIIEHTPQTVWFRNSLADLIKYMRTKKIVKSKETITREFVKEVDHEQKNGDEGSKIDIDVKVDEKNSKDENNKETKNKVELKNEEKKDDKKDTKEKIKSKHLNASLMADLAGDVMADKERERADKLNTNKKIIEP